MDMRAMQDLKEMLCKEIDKIAKKGEQRRILERAMREIRNA